MTAPVPTCWLPECTTEPIIQWQRRVAVGADDMVPVQSCGAHAIELEAGARIHQPTCLPDPAKLPACGCTPEPLPAPTPPPSAPDVVTLPTGWSVPAV